MTPEEPKTDENQKDWSNRFVDPMLRWAWNNATQVSPADSEHGRHMGQRLYPDGTRDTFYVE